MKLIRQYKQETVVAHTPEEFDAKMNAIFTKAAKGGKEPDIHYHDKEGYSATVRYWIAAEIPETIADEFELKGQSKKCFECPAYVPSEDKRVKYTHCEHTSGRISANDCACDWYYETYERRAQNAKVKTIPFRKKPVLAE